MSSVRAVSAIAVQPVSPISPIANPRPVKTGEQPTYQHDDFCPRFVDLNDWDKIAQWYESGNRTCQGCRHKWKCVANKNRG